MDGDFDKCVELLKEQSGTWSGPHERHRDLLEALITLTLEDPKKGTEGFTNIELNEAVNILKPKKPWGSIGEGTTKRVSKAWGQLETLFERKREGLQQRALSAGLNNFISLKKVAGGGGGNPSLYCFSYGPLKLDSKENSQKQEVPIEHGKIRYFTDDVIKIPAIARILSKKLVLSGWRKWLFILGVASISLLIAFVLILVPIGLPQQETTSQFIQFIGGILIILGSLWVSFGPFYRLIESRVEIAPWWLQIHPDIHGDCLLIFQRNKPKSANTVELKRLIAECPYCKGRVFIKKGGIMHLGRLVGHCENSPREHLFSFDHYLRTGAPIK